MKTTEKQECYQVLTPCVLISTQHLSRIIRLLIMVLRIINEFKNPEMAEKSMQELYASELRRILTLIRNKSKINLPYLSEPQ